MSVPLSGLSSSTQLLDLYNQASKKGLLDKRPETLFLRMKDQKLSLEERGFLPWFRRNIFRRADKEYNFVENLAKFQELLEGSLVELQTKKVDPGVVEKIEKLTFMYNSLLASKKEGDASTRFTRYVTRIGKRADIDAFTAERVIKKIPESSEDNLLKFIKTNFSTTIPKELKGDAEEKRLNLSIELLSQNTPQRTAISEAYERLQRRMNVLNFFHPVDETFAKAQEFLKGIYTKTEQPKEGESKGLGRMISLVNSVNQSLEPIVDKVFLDERDEFELLDLEFIDLQANATKLNIRAKRLGYPELFEIKEFQNIKNIEAELNSLLKGRGEDQLQNVEGKISQLQTLITEAWQKSTEFDQHLIEFRSLRVKIREKNDYVKTLEEYGPAATAIAQDWAKKIGIRVNDLKKRGLSAKADVEGLLGELDDAHFKSLVQNTLERQQLEIENTIQSLLFPPSQESSGSILDTYINAIISKLPFMGEDPSLVATKVQAEADRKYGIAKLIAQTDKAVAWSKWLCSIAGQYEIKQPEGLKELQENMVTALSKLKATSAPPPEKLAALFEDFKKIGKINTDLQAAFETRAPPVAHLKLMHSNVSSLSALQEELEILEPLLEEAKVAYSGEYKELKDYCRNTWSTLEQIPQVTPEVIEQVLTSKRAILDALIPILWLSWRSGDPNKTLTDKEFKEMTTQTKARYLTGMSKSKVS